MRGQSCTCCVGKPVLAAQMEMYLLHERICISYAGEVVLATWSDLYFAARAELYLLHDRAVLVASDEAVLYMFYTCTQWRRYQGVEEGRSTRLTSCERRSPTEVIFFLGQKIVTQPDPAREAETLIRLSPSSVQKRSGRRALTLLRSVRSLCSRRQPPHPRSAPLRSLPRAPEGRSAPLSPPRHRSAPPPPPASDG
jgi:hypothetical protein